MKYSVAQVKENKIISKLILENKIPDEYIEEDLTTLNRFLSQYIECENNGGLDKCKQIVKGKQLDLYFKDYRFFSYLTECVHFKNDNPHYENNKNLVFSDTNLNSKFKSINEMISVENKISPINTKNLAFLKEKIEQGMKNQKGMYIYGAVGVGKTEFFKIAANSFLKKGKKVCFIKTLTLTTKVHEEMFGEIKTKKTLNMCKNVEILFLDDIGEEKPTTWKRDEVLFNIIDHRYSNKMLTFFSSNLNLTKLRKKYTTVHDSKQTQADELVSATRLVDRIRGLVNEVEMLGESRR